MDLDITKYVGSTCEVSTMENDLLVSGRISKVITEDECSSVEVVDIGGRDLPHGVFDLPVKIRILNSELGNLVLGGKIFIGNEEFWRICGIRCYSENERRGFFRVKTMSPAKLLTEDQKNKSFKGNITNLSLSGLMIVVGDKECKLHINDKIKVIAYGITDKKELHFDCTVKQIRDHPVAGWMYGCELENMDRVQSDNLCKLIFALQRKEITKKRKRI